jgi:hypothetical protein
MTKISALPSAAALTGSEIVPLDQAGVTVQSSPASILTYVEGAIVAPNSPQTASYKVTAADANTVVFVTAGGGTTLTLPQQSDTALPVGYTVTVVQGGAGQVTFAIQGADNLYSYSSKVKTAGQYAAATAYKRSNGNWYLFGQLG